MVLSLVATLLGGTASYPDPTPPPFSRALGRPLSWDPYGAYGLDAEGPLSPADAAILAQVEAGELGRAELLARNRLRADGEDCLPAWVLGQIFRVKRTALAEYHRNVEGHTHEAASPAILLYRLHVCRVAQWQTANTGPEFDLRQRMRGELESLRDLCRPFANRHLGEAVGITQVDVFWALTNRAVLEAYHAAHPKGVDVRPLICQAYNTGIGYGLSTFPDGHKEKLVWPDEPKPKKALEVALSILKDRPNDPLGLFHAGRSYARLEEPRSARRELQAALDTGDLPPYYEQAAQRYVDTESPNAFLVPVPY